MLITIANFLLYILFWCYIKKQGNFIIPNVFMTSTWVLSALSSVFYYSSPLFQMTATGHKPIITPYILIFCLLFIMYKGVELYDSSYKIKEYRGPLLNPLILLVAISSYLPFIESCKELLVGSFNFINIAETKESFYQGELDSRYYMSWLGARFNSISVRGYFLIPILFFYYICFAKKTNKFIVIGLILAILNPVLNGLIIGGRGVMLSTALYFGFIYILFKSMLPFSFKRILKWIVIIGVSFFALIFILTTIYRFSSNAYNDYSVTDWFIRYLGESMVNFNTECWYYKENTYGLNSIAYYCENDGLRDYQKLEQITKVRMNVYYTMFGDLMLDFGIIGTILIVCFISYIAYKIKPRKGVIELENIILYSLIVYIFMEGVFIWPLINRWAAAEITLILWFLLKITKK